MSTNFPISQRSSQKRRPRYYVGISVRCSRYRGGHRSVSLTAFTTRLSHAHYPRLVSFPRICQIFNRGPSRSSNSGRVPADTKRGDTDRPLAGCLSFSATFRLKREKRKREKKSPWTTRPSRYACGDTFSYLSVALMEEVYEGIRDLGGSSLVKRNDSKPSGLEGAFGLFVTKWVMYYATHILTCFFDRRIRVCLSLSFS